MIFVDTSAWFSVFSRQDVNHAVALHALQTFREPLATSDYVVDETLTLLRARRELHRAIAFGRHIIEGQWVTIVHVEDQDFIAAWNTFKTFVDKKWSFTDCTSRVLMQRLAVDKAFAFDDHFHQFGTVSVVP